MGKYIRFFIGMIMFVCLFSITAFAQNAGRINDVSVNIRSSNSLSSEVLTQLSTGAKVTVHSLEGDFYKISTSEHKTCYVAKQYLDIVTAVGTLNDYGVNIRKTPLMTNSSNIIGQAVLDQAVVVTGIIDVWYEIDYNGETAYIHRDFVDGDLLKSLPKKSSSNTSAQTQNVQSVKTPATTPLTTQVQAPEAPKDANLTMVYGIINSTDGLNFRYAPSLEAEIMFALPYDEIVDVLEIDVDWIRAYFDGSEGYLATDYVSVHTGAKPERVKAVGGLSDQIISYAKKFLGTPYKWAGTNLDKGVDCSGFVYSVMRHFGISLNRTSSGMASNGSKIARSDLLAGDLILFDTNTPMNGRVSHVGIYMGGGQFIHSSSGSAKGVTISSLSEDYYNKRYLTARRVI